MSEKFTVGSTVYIVWYDTDEKRWEVDDSNIYAGEIPLLHLHGIIQANLRKSRNNLYFVKPSEIFGNRADAERAAMLRQSKLKC